MQMIECEQTLKQNYFNELFFFWYETFTMKDMTTTVFPKYTIMQSYNNSMLHTKATQVQ